MSKKIQKINDENFSLQNKLAEIKRDLNAALKLLRKEEEKNTNLRIEIMHLNEKLEEFKIQNEKFMKENFSLTNIIFKERKLIKNLEEELIDTTDLLTYEMVNNLKNYKKENNQLGFKFN